MSYFACEELGTLTKKLADTYQEVFGNSQPGTVSESSTATTSLPEIRQNMRDHQRSCALCRRALMRATKNDMREHHTI